MAEPSLVSALLGGLLPQPALRLYPPFMLSTTSTTSTTSTQSPTSQDVESTSATANNGTQTVLLAFAFIVGIIVESFVVSTLVEYCYAKASEYSRVAPKFQPTFSVKTPPRRMSRVERRQSMAASAVQMVDVELSPEAAEEESQQQSLGRRFLASLKSLFHYPPKLQPLEPRNKPSTPPSERVFQVPEPVQQAPVRRAQPEPKLDNFDPHFVQELVDHLNIHLANTSTANSRPINTSAARTSAAVSAKNRSTSGKSLKTPDRSQRSRSRSQMEQDNRVTSTIV